MKTEEIIISKWKRSWWCHQMMETRRQDYSIMEWWLVLSSDVLVQGHLNSERQNGSRLNNNSSYGHPMIKFDSMGVINDI